MLDRFDAVLAKQGFPGTNDSAESRDRLDNLAELVTITAHPSSILRAQDDAEREDAMEAFVSDLKSVATWLRAR